MNEQITAQETIHYIESGFQGVVPQELRHFCIKGALQSNRFVDRDISVKELLKLIEWEDIATNESK